MKETFGNSGGEGVIFLHKNGNSGEVGGGGGVLADIPSVVEGMDIFWNYTMMTTMMMTTTTTRMRMINWIKMKHFLALT